MDRKTRIQNTAKEKAKEHSLLDKFPIFFRMISQTFKKKYKPKTLNIFIVFAAIVYVFIPEFTDVIPIIGWIDEVTVLGFAFTRINKEIDRFLAWEMDQVNPEINDIGHIVEE